MPDKSYVDPKTWPLPKFQFQIIWNGHIFSAQEVSGLDIEAVPIQYRAGDSKAFSTIKMPGLKKYVAVTLKKILLEEGGATSSMLNSIKMNTAERTPVTISLLDQSGKGTMTWTLEKAWITKMTSVAASPDEKYVAIESMELAHEGLTIANA